MAFVLFLTNSTFGDVSGALGEVLSSLVYYLVLASEARSELPCEIIIKRL